MDDPNFFKFKEQLKECQKEEDGEERSRLCFHFNDFQPHPNGRRSFRRRRKVVLRDCRGE